MEVLQLEILDLPRDNILEVMPRFRFSGNQEDAIARFATLINEIRLDQLPDDLAGHGKSDRHTQPALPIEIEIGDRTQSDSVDESVSGILDTSEDIPETLNNHKKYGHIEPYQVKGRNGRLYTYNRYVYRDYVGIYRHHHIPHKLFESIEELWIMGATQKEICTALGKICKSE